MPKKTAKITTSELLLSAIFYLQQKNGVTAKEITKYICEKRGCAQKHIKDNVKKALERATVRGIFCRNRGLYRINNSFGLNKILNKSKRKGQKEDKETKAKENSSDDKTNFQICWKDCNESEPMLLCEIVDQRMNDDYGNRNVYVDLPASSNTDDDDDEDFKDSEDDEDDNDFFSDDMGESLHSTKTVPTVLHLRASFISHQQMSDCHSFNDPFRRHASREDYPETETSKERLEEKETSKAENEAIKDVSTEPSEDPSESVQNNDENQSEDEGWETDQPPEDTEWDCQPNDLESFERLLERDKPSSNAAEQELTESDVAKENTQKAIQKKNSRVKVFIESLPTDTFDISHKNENTR